MQDLRLLLAVAAAFAFGYSIMKKLDCFLEGNCQALALQPSSSGSSLRIGFSNPLVADSLTGALKEYSKKYPDTFVDLLSGTDEALIQALSTHRLDVVFLSPDVENPSQVRYDGRQIMLTCMPVVTEHGGLSVAPISNSAILQNILWTRDKTAISVRVFIEVLQGISLKQGA